MIKLIDTYSNGQFEPSLWKSQGYSGVIFKGGQGGWADVPRVHPEWKEIAESCGLLYGFYWVCDSRYKSSYHIDEMKKYNIFSDVGKLGLWVDVEKPVITMTEAEYWKSPYSGHKNLVDFVYQIRQNGVSPGIYTGPGAFDLVCRDAPKSAKDYLAECPLWTAQYPFVYVQDVSKPTLYGSWTNWRYWQYREGPDINIYNGTDAEFLKMVGGDVIPTKYEINISSIVAKFSNGAEITL